MAERGTVDDTPLMRYVDKQLWGNPEENQQYQVQMNRVTGSYGVSFNFSFMNKWRTVPRQNRFFDIYSIGGLAPGYWNFKSQLVNRNPLDRWVNVSKLSKQRGFLLDIYNAYGYQFSRSHAWIMVTYDGLVLIALEKLRGYPIPDKAEMWFRCYTPSQLVTKDKEALEGKGNPFHYESLVYDNVSELQILQGRYQTWKGKTGYTATFHNGVFWNGAPNTVPNLKLGDFLEIWHDPTVIRTEIYTYRTLQDFYSELDKKRKVILHPAKRKGDFTIRYFDDNDFYLLAKSNRGLLLNRNDKRTVRQLTHVDVSIADDTVREACNGHPDLSVINDLRILVLVRKTDWEYTWPNESQRIRYLYRLPDADIIRAFTGARANMPEWTANGLESGPVIGLLRSQWKTLNRERAFASIGYNAATRVLSEGTLKAPYNSGGIGVEVPYSYRQAFTAWEYSKEGHLLTYRSFINARYYNPVNPLCDKVEFSFGVGGRTLDTKISNTDEVLSKELDYRIFISAWSVALGKLVGELVDVTGDSSYYEMQGLRLVWKGLDKINQRGVIFSNSKTLAYSFTLNHIDKSLAFALTHIYEPGGLIWPYSFGNVDVWLNGHPLIDEVDYIFRDNYIYIINKEFLREGAQDITVRAGGFHTKDTDPNRDIELGFVDGGVIGRFDRYNLRADRVTRTVINGSLYITDEVPRAERSVPDDQWNVLNGRPYMVKHVFTPILGVKDFDLFPGLKASREVDKRVSDYLTKWLPKPRTLEEEVSWEGSAGTQPSGSGVPAIPNLQDKYKLFSPFLSVIVNGIKNGLIDVPDLSGGDTAFSGQDIEEAVSSYKWWLDVDPVPLKFDRRYFAITPYANVEKINVTSKQLQFIKQVNDTYLDSVCVIEGYFTVNNNG